MTEFQPPPPKAQLEPTEIPTGAKIMAAAVVITLLVGLVALTAGPFLYKGWKEQQLLNKGIDAKAELLKLQDTGDRVNENPVVQLSVEVYPEGGEPYRTTIETPLSPVELANYRVGGQVRVRYNPDDPREAALVGPILAKPEPTPAPASP